MTLSFGTKLGPYEILSPIGAGGMGEVYRAKDTRLDREVAIKVLPDAMTRDVERVARFQREAKVLASLNHPNIAAIYGFEDHRLETGATQQSGATHFLVMEYVEGDTLSGHLKNGAVAVEDALDIAKQIAEALEAAHEKGVIHRDLKPANVMLTTEGKVKVLDFGLAKAMAEGSDSTETNRANSPTITANFTRPGIVLGTAAYMSPEQARGRALDKRTDIWSFGIILFECLTGETLFHGETANDSMGAIMHKDPEWSLLPPGTPPTIQLLLRRCLTKDRKRRLHDIADARIELENAIVDPASTSLGLAQAALDVKRRWLPSWPVNLAFLMVLVLTAFGAWFAKPEPPERPEPPKQLWNLTLGVPEELGYQFWPWGQGIAISSDGSQVVIVVQDADNAESKRRLLLRRTDQSEGVILANTEDVIEACFSPDGQWIAFLADRVLKKISTRGGPATTLYSENSWMMGLEWGKDDTIIFTEYVRNGPGSGLRRISSNGGTPQRLTEHQEDTDISHRHGHFLADGSGITFTAGNWKIQWDDIAIFALRFGDTQPKEIMKGGSGGVSLSTGHLIYRREHTLMAAPFDLSRLEISAPAVPVLEGIGAERAVQPSRVAISDTGTLIYLPDTGGNVSERSLTWVDHEGAMTPLSATLRDYSRPRFSPDGSHLSVAIRAEDGGETDIYILERERDLLRRLTSDLDVDNDQIWSPDGEWIVFTMEKDGEKPNLYRIPSDFSGKAERLTTSENAQYPTDISPDGRLIAITMDTKERESDILLLHLDEQGHIVGESYVISESFSWDYGGRFSPDGKWISYTSHESGTNEVYVKATSGSGAAIQVSTEGGRDARWSPTENKLYFTKNWLAAEVYAVSFTAEDGLFKPALPELVFKMEGTNLSPRNLEVSPDGKQFLFTVRANAAPDVWTNPRIIVNWFEDLKAKVPIE